MPSRDRIGDGVNGRRREHHAAHLVEVPGDKVERLHEPRGERPVLLRAQPDAAVTSGPRRARELAREPARDVRGHARSSSDALWREYRRTRCASASMFAHAAVETPEPHPSLCEDDVQHRREQQGIGSGPDRDMLVGGLRGLGAPRIDDDDAPAAIADGA